MRNIINTLIIVCLFSFLICCSKDEAGDHMLKRDTDQLSFAYGESQQTFTIRVNGPWSIDLSEADWVSVDPVEGTGDGEMAQVVTVTALRNLGDARQGNIRLASSHRQASVAISQPEGRVVFGTAYFTKPLVPDVGLEEAYLVIPYTKGGFTEDVTFLADVTGAGAAGILIEMVALNMSAQVGEIRIPITGTPEAVGAVSFTVSVLGQTHTVSSMVQEQGNTDAVGTVYLRQQFDRLVLGGDHIAKTAGIHLDGGNDTWVLIGGKRVLPENPVYVTQGTGNTDGTGDYFSTMHPSFVAARGLEGWTGRRVYERPGYLKIGTAGSNDGYIATPPLSKIQGWADIKVSFAAARWSENATADASATVTVRVVNVGTSEGADKEITLSSNFTQKEIVIEKATAETVIEFKARNAANGRILIDNIDISKVIR